jgi:hypothetical protein
MFIVWGNGKYVLKNCTATDLGLYTNEYEKYSFQIIQKYFHLFWIPLLPTGVVYTFKKAGSSDQFHVPDSIKQLMMQQQIKWWYKLGGFALPLLIIAGVVIFNISEKADNARYAKIYEQDKAEIASIIANKDSLQKFVQKIQGIDELVRKNYKDKKEGFAKIDTSLQKIMTMLITARLSYTDTTDKFNNDNTLVYHYPENAFIQDEKNELNEKMLEDIWESYGVSGSYASSTVIKWYKDGMINDDIKSVNPIQISSTNDIIDDKAYLVVMRINGFASPKIDNEAIQKRANRTATRNSLDPETPAFETGYVTANAYVYNIAEKKLMFTFKVFAHNSNSITTMGRNNDAQINVLDQLHGDLIRNLNNEVAYTLNIKERPSED